MKLNNLTHTNTVSDSGLIWLGSIAVYTAYIRYEILDFRFEIFCKA